MSNTDNLEKEQELDIGKAEVRIYKNLRDNRTAELYVRLNRSGLTDVRDLLAFLNEALGYDLIKQRDKISQEIRDKEAESASASLKLIEKTRELDEVTQKIDRIRNFLEKAGIDYRTLDDIPF